MGRPLFRCNRVERAHVSSPGCSSLILGSFKEVSPILEANSPKQRQANTVLIKKRKETLQKDIKT